MDIIASHSSCPLGYNAVTGYFYGTNTICKHNFGYEINDCPGDNSNSEKKGLDERKLTLFGY